jgi:hypothetical protein
MCECQAGRIRLAESVARFPTGRAFAGECLKVALKEILGPGFADQFFFDPASGVDARLSGIFASMIL